MADEAVRQLLVEAIYAVGEKRNVSTHLADVVLDALGLERVGWVRSDSLPVTEGFVRCWPLESDVEGEEPVYRLTALSGRPQRCPTCDGDGPDRVDEDFTSGGLEMECGDDWHDSEAALSGSSEVSRG